MSFTRSEHRLTIAALTAAFLICYGQIIMTLVNTWSTNYLYSYGFAVPVIAAFIVWTKGHGLSSQPLVPDYTLGIPITFAGAAMLVVGRLGGIIGLEQLSLIVTATGLLLLLLGRAVVRSHWFAIAYLLLMIPVWDILIDRLQDPSRLLSSRIAANMLDAVGIPVNREGTNIMLPSHTLAVLLECSGVNQLVALTAMVLPAAYLWLDTTARRIALVVVSVVISYVGNGFRIALVGWLAVNGLGDGDTSGSAHLIQGLVVSTLGYLAIGGCFSLLSKPIPAASPEQKADNPPSVQAPRLPAFRRVWLDAAVTIVMLAVGVARLAAMPVDVHLRDNLSALESRIGDWTMESGTPTTPVPFPGIDDDLVYVGHYPNQTGERRFTGADDELVRSYRNESGDRVELYIAYYHRQEEGKELTGDASSDLAAAASKLEFATESGTLGINEIGKEKGARKRGVLYWYDVNGRVVSDVYRLKSYTIWDALTRRRSNGAVVMIAWDGQSGQEFETARKHAMEFAGALVPILKEHLTP